MRARNRNRTTGTPRPRTCMLSRQVSWLTGRCCCPAFPKPLRGLSDIFGQRLTAYSCGGSSGFGLRRTGFPLSSGKNFPGEPRRAHLPATGHDSQRTVSNISASTGSAGESSFKRGQNRFQLLMYPPAAVPGLGKSVGDWRQSPPQNPFRRIRFSR
jgi:hypothetical protein